MSRCPGIDWILLQTNETGKASCVHVPLVACRENTYSPITDSELNSWYFSQTWSLSRGEWPRLTLKKPYGHQFKVKLSALDKCSLVSS